MILWIIIGNYFWFPAKACLFDFYIIFFVMTLFLICVLYPIEKICGCDIYETILEEEKPETTK